MNSLSFTAFLPCAAAWQRGGAILISCHLQHTLKEGVPTTDEGGDRVLVLWYLVEIALYVLTSIAFYRLAKKAGLRKMAWFAWVPVLNIVLQLRMIGKSAWWLLVLLVPIVDIVFWIIWQVKLCRAFGHSGANVWWILVPLVYTIIWIVWGFEEETQYVGVSA